MLPAVIETERLWLVPRDPDHVDVTAAYEACRHGAEGIEAVTRYVPWSPHDHPKETREFLERGAEARADWERLGYAIVPGAGESPDGYERSGDGRPGELAGFCGLGIDWDRGIADLGLWLRRRFWGRGYSGERAVALAEVAVERLDLELIAVTHHVDNDNSRRAIERYVDRMGGRREGVLRNEITAADGNEVGDAVRYSVSAAEFREADPDREVTLYDDAADAPVSTAPAPELREDE